MPENGWNPYGCVLTFILIVLSALAMLGVSIGAYAVTAYLSRLLSP